LQLISLQLYCQHYATSVRTDTHHTAWLSKQHVILAYSGNNVC